MPALKPNPAELLERLLRGRDGPLLHVRQVPAREGVTAPWPPWVPTRLRTAVQARGIEAPWLHQVEAAGLVRAGEHVIISTGTASGKSLAYLLPVLSHLLDQPRATALYLSPTKALAADQLRSVAGLGLEEVRPSGYDGDTPHAEREWIRAHARFVLTNPDMLHRSILPRHARWTSFLRRLSFVVIDECHVYRGVFGSHVAQVLRRLRRVLAHYAAQPPVFVLASATAGDPATSATRLTGLPVRAVAEDSSPRGGVTFGLWEPPLLPGPTAAAEMPRRSALMETADLLADAVTHGARTLAFVRSRRGAEVVATAARRSLAESVPELADRVAAYRAGYLREERRELEQALLDGRLLGLAATNALELGIDVAGLDAVVLSGYPGTLASMWQQAGRAGRRGSDALCVLVARDDPLDTYLVHHPEALFGRGLESSDGESSSVESSGVAGRGSVGSSDVAGRGSVESCGVAGRGSVESSDVPGRASVESSDVPGRGTVESSGVAGLGIVESAVLDPSNPYVLAPHLCCAASELPLTEADLLLFGGDAVRAVLDALVAAGSLRRRPTGWYWADRGRPDVDLRGTGGTPVSVVESRTGRLLGSVERDASHVQVHEGAVYLHQGVSYVVDRLDLDDSCAMVHAEEPDWTTHPRDITGLDVLAVRSYVDAGPVGLFLGEVEVTNQVVNYQRRKLSSRELIDTRPLDLPPRQLRTVAVWWTVSPQALESAGVAWPDVPGALHAAEHASIGLLPLVATCDRWDIGGLSTAMHPDTSTPTVFVYDGHQGGAGFAERAFGAAAEWLLATRTAIAECACETGCPSCVYSPKCGNGNDPLDKAGAVAALDVVLAALANARPVPLSPTPGLVPAPASGRDGIVPYGARLSTGPARAEA